MTTASELGYLCGGPFESNHLSATGLIQSKSVEIQNIVRSDVYFTIYFVGGILYRATAVSKVSPYWMVGAVYSSSVRGL